MTPAQMLAKLRATTPEKVAAHVKKALIVSALQMEGQAKRNCRRVLQIRTGRLINSITAGVTPAPGQKAAWDVNLRAGGRAKGADVPYAAIHEYGGVIRPKNGAYLRIPLGAAVTAAGVDRFATPLRATGAGLFGVVKSKGGSLLLQHRPSGAPWYLLVPEVRMPARPFMRPAFNEVVPQIAGRVETALRQALSL